jgi:hypothetical protein
MLSPEPGVRVGLLLHRGDVCERGLLSGGSSHLQRHKRDCYLLCQRELLWDGARSGVLSDGTDLLCRCLLCTG